MKDVVDFDRMIAEAGNEPLWVRIFDEEVPCRRELPALTALKLIRADQDGETPPDLLTEAGEALFGRERMAAWLERADFSLSLLARLLKVCFEGIGCADGDGQAEPLTEDGEAARPKNGTRWPCGGGSKPIFSANTASTCRVGSPA